MSDPIFGEVTSCYSRRMAIEDGQLVDLMQAGTRKAVREAGFIFPVAMTAAAFSRCVWPIDATPQAEAMLSILGQDLKGRLWDVLWMLKQAIHRQRGPIDVVTFQLIIQQPLGDARPNERAFREGGIYARMTTLKAIIGPGDDGQPVITIMLPEED